MNKIIVTDVFGVTPALLSLSDKLEVSAIVDPYQGKHMDFNNEADAYSYFVETVGLDNYLASLSQVVESIEHKSTLIGFSVGASVIWRLSQEKGNHLIKEAFCFYGSQIRNFTQIEPNFKINMLFPKSEPHFDVVELEKSLSQKVNVNTLKVQYLHGFMNRCSSNYNESGYDEYIHFINSNK
jgi:dienelactone hydrolase